MKNSPVQTSALLLVTALSSGCLDADEEGINEEEVIAGSIEADANFPWVVKVFHPTLGGNCQGALIDARWVITAAHCVFEPFNGLTVSYTRTNPTTGAVTSGSQDTPPNSVGVEVHPDFVNSRGFLSAFNDDIALIRLPQPFAPDPLLRPAELPFKRPLSSGVATLASKQDGGVAQPGTLAVMRGTFAAGCQGSVADSVCLVSSGAVNACGGDSGSGMVTSTDGINHVSSITGAVVTDGGDCGTNENVIGVDVTRYEDWITNTMGLPDNHGGFTPKTQLYSTTNDFGIPSTWESVSGDFNGDGRTDYLRVGAGGAWLYRAQANGTFSESFVDFGGLNFGQPSTWTTVVGNFDRGGTCPNCMDFLRVGATGSWNFFGNSNGTFTRSFREYVNLNFGQPSAWQTAVGDFDGDGRTDYGRLGNTGAWMYYGNSNKSFTQTFYAYQSGYNFGWDNNYSLAIGDFNADGRTDYARVGSTVGYLYYGTGSRGFTSGSHAYSGLAFGQYTTWETISGNFDGDARGDYALVGETGAWLFYGRSGGFNQRFLSFGGLNFGRPSSYETILGDFNGDGRKDFARLGSEGAFFYYGSTSQGAFNQQYQGYRRHFGLPSQWSTVVGDFNGDGRSDYARLAGILADVFLHN